MRDFFKDWLEGRPGVRLGVNAETLLGNKPVAPIIDLQRRYDLQITNCGRGIYRAIDLVTFDPDPEGTLHCEGWGDCSTEAVADLMSKLGAALQELEGTLQ